MQGELSPLVRLQISLTRCQTSNGLLRAQVKELKQLLQVKDHRITELESQLQDKESQRKELLSYLYKSNHKTIDPKRLGKKVGSPAFHRPLPKPQEITERHTYTLQQCPACHVPVGPAVDEVVKYEEDIVLVPRKTVKQFTLSRHWCPKCETFVRASDIPPMARIGPNTLAYILYARYRLRLPFAKIKDSLADLHNFKISEGEIANQLMQAESLFQQDYTAITTLIQTAQVVYADETGWRMDGDNWWLWCFTTPQGTRYLLEDTRGKGIPTQALGKKQDRVIISDGYTAYKNLPGDKQQCWVHLLRVARLHSPSLYGDLALLYHKLLLELEKPLATRDKLFFEKELAGLLLKTYPEPMAKKPQERMRRHRHQLFTCLSFEGVLAENNTAERAIRPQVVMRKIFGGSRSVSGASAHAVNTSVLRTLEQQNPNQNFFDLILPLIEKRRSEW